MALLLWACQSKQERVMAPWGEEVVIGSDDQTAVSDESEDTGDFDLDEIVKAGELIVLTCSGPQTCYDYRGSRLGLHVMLCQQLADSLGIRLRVELCRDTTEMLRRVRAGEGDLAAYPVMPPDSLSPDG